MEEFTIGAADARRTTKVVIDVFMREFTIGAADARRTTKAVRCFHGKNV